MSETLTGIFWTIKTKLLSRETYSNGQETKVNITLVGPRNWNSAFVIAAFFKMMPEGRQLFSKLEGAGRAKLFLYLVNPDVCPVFYERAMTECSFMIFATEELEMKQQAHVRPCSLSESPVKFVVSRDVQQDTPTGTYPVHDGVNFQLTKYSGKIRLTAISPDFTMAEHFLDRVVSIL